MNYIKLTIFLCLILFLASCSKSPSIDTINSSEEAEQKITSLFYEESDESIDFGPLNEDLIDQKFRNKAINTLESGLNQKLDQIFSGEDNASTDLNSQINVHAINILRSIQEKEAIDAIAYANEGNQLLNSDNLHIAEVVTFLKKYNVYQNSNLDAIELVHNRIEKTNDIKQVDEFENVVLDSEASIIEKNILLIYSDILRKSIHENDELLKGNDCYKCVKKKKWRIFGFGYLIFVALVLACLLLAPALGIGCIVGAGLFTLIGKICLYCKKECPNICGG